MPVAELAQMAALPPAGFDRFDPRNTRIHGIRATDVVGAATGTASRSGAAAGTGAAAAGLGHQMVMPMSCSMVM